ncbi:hypothetical protein C8A05DRAFT_14042 [Staphylotrichum tortipilum]|uniref:Uncharacterized protein n=1 Tax=Staphylotrichum tortipilum TaxID=2831512 RepID=A0AAN6RVX0_9PEZI|nr:hypothetical protein C8A05DRAFT_14042 [Staphylotrichum longicolle]
MYNYSAHHPSPSVTPFSPSLPHRIQTQLKRYLSQMPLKTALLFLLLPFTLAQRPTPTPLYINQVPAYSSLPSCAERPLSTIVRGMARGCGDHNAVTSYDCFCTSSSSFFSSVISSSVAEECGAAASVEAALGVFGEYCALRAGGGEFWISRWMGRREVLIVWQLW